MRELRDLSAHAKVILSRGYGEGASRTLGEVENEYAMHVRFRMRAGGRACPRMVTRRMKAKTSG